MSSRFSYVNVRVLNFLFLHHHHYYILPEWKTQRSIWVSRSFHHGTALAAAAAAEEEEEEETYSSSGIVTFERMIRK